MSSQENQGIVIEDIGNSMVKVRASRHGDCKNCGMCPGADAMVIDAKNPLEAKPGQHVIFEIKQVNMLKAAFVVYILPLVAAFLGVVIGGKLSGYTGHAQSMKAFQIGGGIIAFIISIIYVKIFDKAAYRDQNMQPVITRILY
ncbi:siderophore-interacting protein [Clostridium fermenticellae]|uniref:Siderophore-interacting protein n=1 Tax=Clostridium fermenticellae TaxID=2068654 RepID=A0A386H4G8_9CLOT|nr:SoxR reducing system RseC family protein [Clostridium fermenticellae]AYD40570.1 siderophore-interacting protein [Clostridium fermenticellae]